MDRLKSSSDFIQSKRMKILITGGTGSLGTALVEKWHSKHDLVIFSRDPHRQEELRDRFRLNHSQFVLGDICNVELVNRTIYNGGFDLMIHAAALKIVSQGELHPEEYYRVNSQGSITLARAWNWYNRNKPAIYIQSDKGVQPINLYGASKLIGEKVFSNYGLSSLRYGNVVSSKGSFIHKWLEAKKQGDKVKVKLPVPTRFFLTIDEAVNLVEDCLDSIPKYGNGVYVPRGLKSFSVYDVATELGLEIDGAELEQGEKQHEILLAEDEIIDRFATGKLAKIKHGYGDRTYWYSSETAKKMTGREVMEKLRL